MSDPAQRLGAEKGIPVTRVTSMHPAWVKEEALGVPCSGNWPVTRRAAYESATTAAQREEDKSALEATHDYIGHFAGDGARDVFKDALARQAYHPSLIGAIRKIGPHLDTEMVPSVRSMTLPTEQAYNETLAACRKIFGSDEGARIVGLVHGAVNAAHGSDHDKGLVGRMFHSLFTTYAGHVASPPTPHHPQIASVPGQHAGAGNKPFSSAAHRLYRRSAASGELK